MAVRKVETFPPVTMGHIRGHGCRDLLQRKIILLVFEFSGFSHSLGHKLKVDRLCFLVRWFFAV
jgi:hypothetical protein